MRGLVQADARVFWGDNARKLPDQLVGRRIRPILAGQVGTWLTFQITPDFGAGLAVLQDAWVDVSLHQAAQVRVGKFKSPFGLERLRSAAALGFVERGYPSQLAPNRDFGLQVHGEVLDRRVGYAVALVNGTPDGASVDGDNNDSKDLVARVYAMPFVRSETPWLRELLMGAAGSWGDQDGTSAAPGLSSWRTPGQVSFFRVRPETTVQDSTGQPVTQPAVVARGVRQRTSLHGYWFAGPASLLTEWVQVRAGVAKGGQTGAMQSTAWQVAAAWVLGGTSHWTGVQPNQPLTLGQPGWGAAELALRWSQLQVDAAERWADTTTSARQANSLSVGVHWHWSPQVRLFADLERTTFVDGDRDGSGTLHNRPTELVLLTRAQLAW